ncbi:protein of unknown function [Candidatus Nitrospira inopinata]|uniref:Uncharacterized protein n=1 Tax=Candidatus Nitrospira inopinata TaxID=1715989 RepID=A0A0S4KWS6_9BACT|nr:protein of unknown function [Candidatus Nitrospira inopinata]
MREDFPTAEDLLCCDCVMVEREVCEGHLAKQI